MDKLKHNRYANIWTSCEDTCRILSIQKINMLVNGFIQHDVVEGENYVYYCGLMYTSLYILT